MDVNGECLSKNLTILSLDLQSKYKNNEQIVETLEQTLSICKLIVPELRRYDVTPSHQANGYRSLLRRYISLLEYSNTSQDDQSETLLPLLQFYQSSVTECNRWITTDSDSQKVRHFVRSYDDMMKNLQNYYKHADACDFLLSKLGREYGLSATGIRLSEMFRLFLSVTQANSPWTKIKHLFDQRSRIEFLRNYYGRPSLGEIVNFVNMSRSAIMTHVYPYLAFSRYPYTMKRVTLPHHRPYAIVHDHDNRVFRVERNCKCDEDDGVECFIFKSTGSREEGTNDYSDTIIIYMHGGGFVMQATETTKNFLPSFISKLPGITVIAVNYDAAPGHKFPRALQQCLDTTLFFLSDRSQVQELLGFRPKKYILAGDSSGAMGSIATLIAINEINHLKKVDCEANENKLPLPIAYLGVYPLFYIGPMFSPALLAGYKDVVIFPHFLLQMAGSRLPELKDASFSQFNEQTPWFTRDPQEVKEIIAKYDYVFSSPLFSPICYDKWNEIAPVVDLIMFTLHDDPLLDFALSLVPVWKENGGRVHLDVVGRLKHGCFYFMAIAKVFFKSLYGSIDEAENLIVNRIKNVLDGEKIAPPNGS